MLLYSSELHIAQFWFKIDVDHVSKLGLAVMAGDVTAGCISAASSSQDAGAASHGARAGRDRANRDNQPRLANPDAEVWQHAGQYHLATQATESANPQPRPAVASHQYGLDIAMPYTLGPEQVCLQALWHTEGVLCHSHPWAGIDDAELP